MVRYLLLSVVLVACGDGSKKRPLGESCVASDECASGLCASGQCLDPEADNDVDGLTNRIEAGLGTDPLMADSDGDGIADPDELTEQVTPKDTDGDGLLDALESAAADEDLDCLSDERDARNKTVDVDPELVALHCPDPVGVCAEGMVVMCRAGQGLPVCEPIVDYEADEATCDQLDNDCDGSTDEGLLNACGTCGAAPVETCNGQDDDCDGSTDEGLLNVCGACGEVPTEICNGQDDDCDGSTDEGCDPLLAGLIVHWPLDGDGADLSINEDHGTVNGATATSDRFGQANAAMHFGAEDTIEVAATEHPTVATDATYALWIRPDAGTDTARVMSFAGATSVVVVGPRNCAVYSADAACAPAGFWSFLVVVRSGDTVTTYLDGNARDVATLTNSALATTDFSVGNNFVGSIDDVRAWSRALSQAEVDQLFFEGGWQSAGTAAHPGRDCLHLLEAGRGSERATPESATYPIDLDGDGPGAAFDAYCDMDLDGGGWTLAWVYGVTHLADFLNINNAVTPVPTWPKSRGDAPTSITPPTSPTSPGAIDWAQWSAIGREFAIISDLADGIACQPRRGSLADGWAGSIDCRTVAEVTNTCQGVVPRWMGFGGSGPLLRADGVYFNFDGDSASGFPTHDPCGHNSTNHVPAPARGGGAVYLRWSDAPITRPTECDELTSHLRRNGPALVDPDGPTGDDPFTAQCLFDSERGGWTRLDGNMAESVAARPTMARRYLYRQGTAFYLSPATTAPWADTYAAAAGRWVYRGGTAGSFDCAASNDGTTGVGCGDIEGPGVFADGPLVDGTAPVCQAPPDVFDTAEVCADTEIWVREHACVPDPGSLLGDGELDQVVGASDFYQSNCWYAESRTGWKHGVFADYDEVPPNGKAPSLRMQRPPDPTLNPYVELGQYLTLVAGKAYTYSFWAKAKTRTVVNVGVRGDASQIYYERLTLTPEWRRVDIGFEVRTTAWMASVWIGSQDPTVEFWVDGLALTEDGPTPCDGDDTNLIGNGDFAAGTTCWLPGNSDVAAFGTFDIEPSGGPDGQAAWRIDIEGAPAERWHVQTRNQDFALEAGYRYRLSFAAKASEQRSFGWFVARFDQDIEDPPVWASNGDSALTTAWRTYTTDFVPTFGTEAVLANLSFDFGGQASSTVWLADVRLEKLEFDPCAPEDGVSNPGFDHGFACWEERHHWETVDMAVSVEDGVAVADIISNTDAFEYAAQIRVPGIPLVAGNVYEMRVNYRTDEPRVAYWNIQNYPTFYAGHQMFYDNQWRGLVHTFVQSASSPGADLEFGFGGEGFTGRTEFDDVALIDWGPDGCKPTDGLVPNVGFDQGLRCWNMDAQRVNRIWGALDTTTFGDAAPSLRLDVVSTTQVFDAWVQFSGLSVVSGQPYIVRFKARAAQPTTMNVGLWQPPEGTSIGYGEQSLTTAWQTYSYEFQAPITTTTGMVSINVGTPGTHTIWIDDFEIQAL